MKFLTDLKNLLDSRIKQYQEGYAISRRQVNSDEDYYFGKLSAARDIQEDIDLLDSTPKEMIAELKALSKALRQPSALSKGFDLGHEDSADRLDEILRKYGA